MLRELFRRKSIDRILRQADRQRMEAEHGGSLKRTLRARDLTAFGIAAIIGSGIFATVGQAASAGGPAVSLLFVFIAMACCFTAFCYAEFASMIPISGSAYTYAYASFGELVAWIIGWDLLLEYAIGILRWNQREPQCQQPHGGPQTRRHSRGDRDRILLRQSSELVAVHAPWIDRRAGRRRRGVLGLHRIRRHFHDGGRVREPATRCAQGNLLRNGRYAVPLLYVAVIFVVYRYFKTEAWDSFFSMEPRANAAGQMESGWDLFKHKIPMILFILVATAVAVLSFAKRLSLIPVLGLLTCFYLMTQLGITNWARFLIWLVAGLAIYFLYGRKASKLNRVTD